MCDEKRTNIVRDAEIRRTTNFSWTGYKRWIKRMALRPLDAIWRVGQVKLDSRDIESSPWKSVVAREIRASFEKCRQNGGATCNACVLFTVQVSGYSSSRSQVLSECFQVSIYSCLTFDKHESTRKYSGSVFECSPEGLMTGGMWQILVSNFSLDSIVIFIVMTIYNVAL